jgi:hypothetical protein
LAIFFLVTGFIPRADYAELGKLHSLIQHFEFHQKTSTTKISFFEFLNMHYDSNNQQEHDEQHEELPFHNHAHEQCAGGILMFPISFLDFSFIQNKFELVFQFSKIKHFVASYFGAIWQPPC